MININNKKMIINANNINNNDVKYNSFGYNTYKLIKKLKDDSLENISSNLDDTNDVDNKDNELFTLMKRRNRS